VTAVQPALPLVATSPVAIAPPRPSAASRRKG
jgi:hypothetical protein